MNVWFARVIVAVSMAVMLVGEVMGIGDVVSTADPVSVLYTVVGAGFLAVGVVVTYRSGIFATQE